MGSGPYITDAGAASQGALLHLETRGSSPPTNAYVANGSVLVVTIFTDNPSCQINTAIQLLLPDGRVTTNSFSDIPSNTSRAANILKHTLPECYILGLSVTNTTGVGFTNRTYVNVKLQSAASGGINIAYLTQGYVNFQNNLSWPPGVTQGVTDGAGGIVSVTGTTPAAGAEISETVPTGAVWRLKMFIFKLTANATVGTRITHLIIDDGTNVLLNVTAPTGVAASANATYMFGDDTITANVSDGVGMIQFPASIRLAAGYRIRTLTTTLQGGDQYTAPQYQVEEWLVQ